MQTALQRLEFKTWWEPADLQWWHNPHACFLLPCRPITLSEEQQQDSTAQHRLRRAPVTQGHAVSKEPLREGTREHHQHSWQDQRQLQQASTAWGAVQQ
jgi:hypothetical protein